MDAIIFLVKKINIAFLVSGRGSNLQAIIDAVEEGKINAKIVCVISNIPTALALEKADKYKITAIVIDHTKFANKESYEDKIIEALKNYKIDLICLAGYMRILGPKIIGEYKGKIMNIHPALLPSFPGLDAWIQALEAGVKISGCTVHFVDEGCDTGPIILQKEVPVLDDDTRETLAWRILKEEHKLYPEAIRLFSEGRLEIEGRKVRIK